MKHLFLSPHLDDVIASCGGTISMLIDRGEHVVIYNMFSGYPISPYSELAQRLHIFWGNPKDVMRLRRAEDGAAAAKLGAIVHYDNIPDAIYRKDNNGAYLYDRDEALFQSFKQDDKNLVSYFYDKILSYVGLDKYTIYAPLGIGKHIDHQIAFEVGIKLCSMSFYVLHYEDFPYVVNASKYQERLNEIFNLKSVDIPFKIEYMYKKIDAFSYYISQIPFLFGSTKNMRQLFFEHSKKTGNTNTELVERYWVIN